MIRSLVLLELRRLLPWLVVWTLTCGLTCLYDVLSGAPDQQAQWMADTVYSLHQEFGVELMLYAFLLCYSGFPREEEDGTLKLLLALPVPRWHLFVAKGLAVAGALGAGVFFGLGWKALYVLPNVSSFDGQVFRWDWAATSLFLALAVVGFSVSYSLLLTVFRQLALVVLAVFFIGITVYRAESGELLRVLPSDVLEPSFFGTQWLVPWRSLGIHLAASSLSLVAAGWLWLGQGRQWVAAVGDSAAIVRPIGKWVALGGAAVALLVLGIGAAFSGAIPGGSRFSDPSGPVSAQSTAAYEFRFRQAHATTVETLANVADVDYADIASRFALPPTDRRIVVDMTRWSSAAHGSAVHDNIRMRLFDYSTVRQLRSTLSHETAHVLANRISLGQTSKRDGAYLYFDEGLATQVALAVIPDPDERERNYFEAMALHARHVLSAQAVVEPARSQRRFGAAIRYPLGLTWVEALQGVCGQDAPSRLLQTMARDDLPLDLKPQSLWRQLTSRIGCDWATVVERWLTDLALHRASWNEELQQLPHLVGGRCVQRADGAQLTVVVRGAMPPGGKVGLSLRKSFTGGLEDGHRLFQDVGADGTVSFHVPEMYILKGRVDYQLSLHWPRSGTETALPNEYQQAFVQRDED